jgi:cellulose synthase operon protein C
MDAPSALQIQLAGALEEVATRVLTMRRRRAPVEAPVAHTNAYACFMFACGFASLRDRARAQQYREQAHANLETVAQDPVHRLLSTAFDQCVVQAFAGEPWDAPASPEISRMYGALEPIPRYRVDRLREASRILESKPVDAIGSFARLGDDNPPETLLPDIATIADPVARAERLERLIDASGFAAGPIAVRVLELAAELPEQHAVPVLLRAIPTLDKQPLVAHGVGVAVRFGWGELVPGLVDALCDRLGREAPDHAAISLTIRALRCLDLQRELVQLLDAIGDDAHPTIALIRAGALVLVDERRGRDALAAELERRAGPTNLIGRLETTRMLAAGYAHSRIDVALHAVAELVPQLANITDSFGTNSHFCIAVLHYVESLTLGIAGLDFDRPGWPLAIGR